MKIKVRNVIIPLLLTGTIAVVIGSKTGRIKEYKEIETNEIDNNVIATISEDDNVIENQVEESSEEQVQEEVIEKEAQIELRNVGKEQEQPVVEEPVVEQPVVEEPVVEQPVVEEKQEEKVPEKSEYSDYYGLQIEKKKVVKANTNVNIREGATTESNKLGLLYTGQTLDLIYQENEDWYKAKYNDKEVYISAKHSDIIEKEEIKTPILKNVCFTQNSNLYQEDNLENILEEVPYLEVASVYSEYGDLYVTNINNKIGLIRKSDTEALEGTYVIVDISDQTASLYENNEVVATTPVVTGKNSTPTTKGLHKIWLMESNRYLKGDNYNVHVDVIAFFHNGEGLHDASWRSSFGGEIYKSGGSHGCVNMPTSAAKTFYNNLEVGDKVLVKQ